MSAIAAGSPFGTPAREMPDGPAELWFAVFADDGTLMGAAPAAGAPRWLWRDGKLACSYSPVKIVIRQAGRYATGLICAVSPVTRAWRPLWPVTLGPPGELRAGDFITIEDGVISVIPELPGPHGLRMLDLEKRFTPPVAGYRPLHRHVAAGCR